VDIAAILATLNDLPSTFKRDGAPYTQFVDSLATALSLYTLGADTTFGQIANFEDALDDWIDIWGLLFGVSRGQNESNATYKANIENVLLAWMCTLPAVQVWMNLFAPGGIVEEKDPGPGYILRFSGAVTLARIQQFLLLFNRIRPNGVPFQIEQAGLGLYLGTEEFTGDGRVVGNYLSSLTTPVALVLPASTPNAVPLLDTRLLTDPTLNP